MSIKEEWRPIKGYEGFYEVSNLGRVRSLDREIVRNDERKQFYHGITLKNIITKIGYAAVFLCKNNKYTLSHIHRVVATAFIPNPQSLPQVNHIDGNKQNNHVDNLEWCTAKQNTIHAFNTGLIKSGAKHHASKLTFEQVQKIRNEYIPYDRLHGGVALSKKYGVSPETINKIIHNKTYKK